MGIFCDTAHRLVVVSHYISGLCVGLQQLFLRGSVKRCYVVKSDYKKITGQDLKGVSKMEIPQGTARTTTGILRQRSERKGGYRLTSIEPN
jgi:hypothetical protein